MKYTIKERNEDLTFNSWNLKHKVITREEWKSEKERIERKYRVSKLIDQEDNAEELINEVEGLQDTDTQELILRADKQLSEVVRK